MEDIIILLVGYSGAGKTAVSNVLAEKYGLKELQSYTTRPPRYDGEIGHTFVTDQEFDDLTGIVAYTLFDGHRYCATAQQVDENDIYVIDMDGCESFAETYQGNKKPVVCWVDCPPLIRMERVMHRDGGLAGARRIENDNKAFKGGLERLGELFDNVFVVDNSGEVELTAAEIMCCVDFVRGAEN